jgi:chromosome segregation ATPase
MVILIGFLASGCEESDAVKIKRMKQQTERQALSVRDLALDNQKLSDQNKKLTSDLEAGKKAAAELKAALDTLRKEHEATVAEAKRLGLRTAELEKETERLNRLLQGALENYNKMGKELEALKKTPAAATEEPQRPAPRPVSPPPKK